MHGSLTEDRNPYQQKQGYLAVEATGPVDTVDDIGSNDVLAPARPGHLKLSFETSVSQVCERQVGCRHWPCYSANFMLASDSERNQALMIPNHWPGLSKILYLWFGPWPG